MGWCSGSEILGDVLAATLSYIPKNKQEEVVAELIGVFEGHDCDTIYELADDYPLVGKIMKELHPDYYDCDE